jgi:hypothetical protein
VSRILVAGIVIPSPGFSSFRHLSTMIDKTYRFSLLSNINKPPAGRPDASDSSGDGHAAKDVNR